MLWGINVFSVDLAIDGHYRLTIFIVMEAVSAQEWGRVFGKRF